MAIALAHLQTGHPGTEHCKPVGFTWADHVEKLSERDFKLRYRMDSDSFYELLDILKPGLEGNEKKRSQARCGVPIELETRLAAALRFFAGGSYLDITLIYDISEYTFWQGCVWPVVDAINTYLNNVNFPINDPAALAELEADFRAGTRGDFWRGQVGAIDGVHFKMKCPTAKEVKDPQRYHISRKDMYALLGVAICDYHRRFTWFDITHASCTHDSTAFSATALGQDVVSGKLPYPYFLNGDAAFTLGPHMIIPSNNDPNLDDFDFYQSSNRMAIECAFGILVRRWGVLWRSLSVKFNRRAPLVGALMRLHNFCIDRRLMADSDMPDVQSSYAQVQRCSPVGTFVPRDSTRMGGR